jgi:hypothetical protein
MSLILLWDPPDTLHILYGFLVVLGAYVLLWVFLGRRALWFVLLVGGAWFLLAFFEWVG